VSAFVARAEPNATTKKTTRQVANLRTFINGDISKLLFVLEKTPECGHLLIG